MNSNAVTGAETRTSDPEVLRALEYLNLRTFARFVGHHVTCFNTGGLGACSCGLAKSVNNYDLMWDEQEDEEDDPWYDDTRREEVARHKQRVVAALGSYVDHFNWCNKRTGGHCHCGLDHAIPELWRP